MILLNEQTEQLIELIEYMKRSKENCHASGSAVIVLQNNKVKYESYTGTHHFQQGARKVDASSRFNVYSVRVTFIALAAAIAIYEGKLNLDNPLKDFFPKKDSSILEDTTLRHLLTRSTGLVFNENEITRTAKSGTHIERKRPDLVSTIIFQATGKTVAQMLNESIIQRLGWKETGWMTEGQSSLVSDITSISGYPSIRLGSNRGDERNLFISARELAMWGNLHLNKGKVDGIQVVPEEIFDLAVSIQSPETIQKKYPAFGFFWWVQPNRSIQWEKNELGDQLPEGSYQLLGASGCSCMIIPKYNAVAVRMFNSLCQAEETNYDYIEDIKQFGNLITKLVKDPS